MAMASADRESGARNAVKFLLEIMFPAGCAPSSFWPKLKPKLVADGMKARIDKPESVYQSFLPTCGMGVTLHYVAALAPVNYAYFRHDPVLDRKKVFPRAEIQHWCIDRAG